MRKRLRYLSQTAMLSVLSAGACVLAVVTGVSAMYSFSENPELLERSVEIDGRNSDAVYRLARLRHLEMTEGEDKTEALYFESLSGNPLMAVSWLGLSELYIDSGREADSEKALRMAQGMMPSSPGLLWESSMLAFRLGDNDLALDNLRVVAEADPTKRKRVFDISWRVVKDHETILERAVSDEVLPSYLGYLIQTDRQGATYPVWERLGRNGGAGDETALAYADYLLVKGDTQTAREVWAGLYPGEDVSALVWNGGFEYDTVGRGFDWKINRSDGVDADYDYRKKTEGQRSLHVKFSGEKNVDWKGVSQTVAVKPGSRYALTWEAASSDITTRSGVTVEVYCRGFKAESEPYTGSADWERQGLEFDAPADCPTVTIGLRREKSRRLDNLISGEFWLDDVRMTKTGNGRPTDA
ncbi:MAG TPA: hypothetical protein PKC29_12945 [Thermodesulfobacteriota bacterium]|nr:hypothetical protein [Thermodesulfobacteriota bacterium]